MSTIDTGHLLALFHAFLSNDPNQNTNANAELLRLKQSPSLIFPTLELLQLSQPKTNIRQITALITTNLLTSHFQHYTSSDLDQIKTSILFALSGDPSLITLISPSLSLLLPWPELGTLADSLMESDLTNALLLYSFIIPQVAPSEEIIQATLDSLVSPSPTLRLSALTLVDVIIAIYPVPEDTLQTLLSQSLSLSLSELNEHTESIVNKFIEISESDRTSSDDLSLNFGEIAFAFLDTHTLPIALRSLSLRLISSCSLRLLECNCHMIPNYVRSILGFATDLEQIESDMNQFEIGTHFIFLAAASVPSPYQILSFITSAGLSSQLTLLFIASIVEAAPETIYHNIETLISILDSTEIVASNTFLNELALHCPKGLAKVSNVVLPFILQNYESYETLARVLRELRGIPFEVIKELVDAARDDEAIWDCIAECDMKNDSAAYVLWNIKEGELSGGRLRTISKIAKEAPSVFYEAVERDSDRDDYGVKGLLCDEIQVILHHSSEECLNVVVDLIEYQPLFISQYLHDILESTSLALSDTTTEATALVCISKLFGTFPDFEGLLGVVDEIKAGIQKCSESGSQYQLHACRCLKEAAKGFAHHKVDIFQLIAPFLVSLRSLEQRENIIAIHEMLSQIIRDSGKDFIVNHGRQIMESLNNGLAVNYTGYLMFDLCSHIDFALQPALFTAFREAILSLEGLFEPYIESTCTTLIADMTSRCECLEGFTYETLARIFYFCQYRDSDLINELIERSVRAYRRGDELIRDNVIKCIIYLILAGIDGIDLDIHEVEENMLSEIDIALWGVLVMRSDEPVDEKRLSRVFDIWPGLIDVDVAPWLAHLLVYGMGHWADIIGPRLKELAASVLSVDTFYLVRAGENTLRPLSDIFDDIADTDLLKITGGNQRAFLKIRENTKVFRGM